MKIVRNSRHATEECDDAGETLRSYLTRFNAATAAADKLDSCIILMAAVSRVASKTDFKVALERDSPTDLAKFYHNAERYLRQEDAETEDVEIKVVDDRKLSKAENEKDKGKGRTNDNFEKPKRQRRESKFSSY